MVELSIIKEHNCPLCDEILSKENIINEYKHTVLMFNRYPYIPGRKTIKNQMVFDRFSIPRF